MDKWVDTTKVVWEYEIYPPKLTKVTSTRVLGIIMLKVYRPLSSREFVDKSAPYAEKA
jgi:hypothetical protein